MKRLICFILFCFVFLSMAYAQVEIKGIVVDAETGESIAGASIVVTGTQKGTSTNLNGTFSVQAPSFDGVQIEISYIGYVAKKLSLSGDGIYQGQPADQKPVGDLGTIMMESDEVVLGDVVVTASVAIQRRTPVAVSVIEPEQIALKIGTQEFPEILKTTPGVYATKQGGGYGDSRINIRGFESQNVAVMINGVPMNDMEWGGVYWSNWSGISDVTRSTQVQRGLGAAKVSAPSIGGSVNILTRTTDVNKGGSVSYGMGNNGYNKLGFSVSSGLTDNNWAITLAGYKTWGEGYILGTEFESYAYFLNISKRFNYLHTLSLTAFGASQKHNQRYNGDMLRIEEWQKLKDRYRYNATYGFDANGQRMASNHNRSHKPQISLNHYWTINDRSSLSTALYLSLCDAAGLSWQGANRNQMYGTSNGTLNTNYRTVNGYYDYAGVQAENASNLNGSGVVLAEARNNHVWTGLLSTYTTKLSDKIDFYGGIDLRYYEGLHDTRITDLMGGQFFVDNSRATVNTANNPKAGNPAWVNEKLIEGDIVYRDNTGYVAQAGAFAQAEYVRNKFSAFISSSLTNSTYWKTDRFYYENDKSEVKSFIGYTLKGGANYNLSSRHNIFTNIGYISRAPFMSGGYFTNIHQSNVVNKGALNEKTFSMEAGYGFKSRYLSANINAYRTIWMDKTMIYTIETAEGRGRINLSGVDAIHQGIELEFVLTPAKSLKLSGMVSLGDWRWNSVATGYAYNDQGQAIDRTGAVTGEMSDKHARSKLDMKGVRVGNSAQKTLAFGASYKFLQCLTAGLDYTHYADNYAYFNIPSTFGDSKLISPWKIPDAGILDFYARYEFTFAGLNTSLTGNINNMLNQDRITDARDYNVTESGAASGSGSTWRDVAVMYDFGRTYSLSMKVKF